MIKILIPAILVLSLEVQAKLLDKVAGVINDKVFTLSEIKRVKKTAQARKQISPFIYSKDSYNESDILKLFQNTFIIKDKLSELGFIISDDAVDSRLDAIKKQKGMSDDDLEGLIAESGLTFNEYYEIYRAGMEFEVFQRRIIGPLVTITDQEVKNFYYKVSKNKKTISFKYKVVMYSLPKSKVLKEDLKRLPSILQNYKQTGNIPQIYSDISILDLGTLSGEDINNDLKKLLRQTNEGTFSTIQKSKDSYSSYYLIKKEIAESSDFLANKGRIHSVLFAQRAQKISDNWLSREALNYYTLNNL